MTPAQIKMHNEMETRRAITRLKNVARMIKNENSINGLDACLREMVNYAKAAGPWMDRTHNLRSSISSDILKPRQVKSVMYETATTGAQQTNAQNYSTNIAGIFFAGMEYAIYVEYLEHLWVLSGAVEAMKKNLAGKLAKNMKFKKLRLPRT